MSERGVEMHIEVWSADGQRAVTENKHRMDFPRTSDSR